MNGRIFSELTQEDRIFLSRVEESFFSAEEKCVVKFTAFLDGRQQLLVQQAARKVGFENYLLFGGLGLEAEQGERTENERRMLGCFPYYETPSTEAFPIVPLTFSYRTADILTHRDFLGCFMALDLKRETIGDILVGEGRCVAFFQPHAAEIVLGELSKIGRVGVKVQRGIVGTVPSLYRTRKEEGVVSSLRLDCLVALVCKVSREKAQQLVRSGLVTLCWQICTDTALLTEEGDVFSVRGFGKFRLEEVGAVTKKGRLHLVYSQYI